MGKPYLTSDELAQMFGYSTQTSLYSAISRGTFPIPTYRVGRYRVADREVVDAFFRYHREVGHAQLRLK